MTNLLVREIDWYEGVFLRPQHFQHQDNRLKAQYSFMKRSLSPYAWGVERVELNEQSLASGILSTKMLKIIMEDGTDIEIGKNAILEPRDLQEHISEIDVDSLVYIGVRSAKEDFDNVLDGQKQSDLDPLERTRFIKRNNVESVYDVSQKNSREDVQFLTYNVQYFLSHELSVANEFEVIPIAKIRKINSRIVLDSSYVPPSFNIFAHPLLLKHYEESINACAEFVDENNINNAMEGSDPQEVIKRQLVNQVLVNYISETHLEKTIREFTPYNLWRRMKKVIYSLSSFSEKRKLVDQLSEYSTIDQYNHLDVSVSIVKVLDEIKTLLKEFDGYVDYQVNMDFDGTYFVAPIDGKVVSNMESLYLLVKTSLPLDYVTEVIIKNLKVGSKQTLPVLVSRSLQGVSLSSVDSKEEKLLEKSNSQYVRLDGDSDLWKNILDEGNLSIYIDSVPSDIQFELVGVA